MKNIDGKVSIVMPAYNEGNRIAFSVEETAKTLKGFGCPWELVVIDDGSTDDTFEKLKNISSKYDGHLIAKRNPNNWGKGRTIKKALHYVTGDYIVFLDADLDLHPVQVQTLFDIMNFNNADIVIGSKLHPNSIVNYPWHRRICCLIYFFIIKLLFSLPCRDTQTGLKLFKTEVLRKVMPRLLVKRFAFDVELLVNARRLGYKIIDAPINIEQDRHFRFVTPVAIFTTLLDTMAIFYRVHILRYYDRIDYYRRKNLAKEFRRMRR